MICIWSVNQVIAVLVVIVIAGVAESYPSLLMAEQSVYKKFWGGLFPRSRSRLDYCWF